MRIWLCGLLFLCVGCASVGTTESKPIVFGSDLGNRPFAYIENNRPQGFEPELIVAVATALDRRIALSRMPFGLLIDAVVSGEIDVACATLGITPERAAQVAFTVPYYVTEISVVVPIDSPLQTTGDLAGKRIGASRGTTSERAVRQQVPTANLVLDRKENVSFAMLLDAGDVDAAAMDGPDAQRMVSAAPTKYRRLGALSTERYAMAVHPENSELLQELNLALARLKSEGRIETMLLRHAIPRSQSR